jgi:hypothetical protein
MRKIVGWAAAFVTLLTLLGLTLDLPKKLRDVIGPTLGVTVLWEYQKTFAISATFGPEFSEFNWNSIFQIQNFRGDDVIITGLENVFPERNGIILKQKGPSQYIEPHDSIEDFKDLNENKASSNERLPYTIKGNAKKYILLNNSYQLIGDGNILSCQVEDECYKMLTRYLGVGHGTSPMRCYYQQFHTRIDYHGHWSDMTEQHALLLVPGCTVRLPLAPRFPK